MQFWYSKNPHKRTGVLGVQADFVLNLKHRVFSAKSAWKCPSGVLKIINLNKIQCCLHYQLMKSMRKHKILINWRMELPLNLWTVSSFGDKLKLLPQYIGYCSNITGRQFFNNNFHFLGWIYVFLCIWYLFKQISARVFLILLFFYADFYCSSILFICNFSYSMNLFF